MKIITELIEYREMIFSLVHRDLRGRYKGSFLGFLWSFLNPLLQLIVYTIVFSIIMRAGIQKYYLFLFVALVPWGFFNAALVSGSTCVLFQKDLIQKIYFPRQVLPLAFTIAQFINMLLSFVVIIVAFIIFGDGFNIVALFFLPFVMFIEFLLALGVTFVTSAATVYFRDLEYVLGIIAMAWQFLSPVIYSVQQIPMEYRKYFNLNPMTSVLTAYRDILYYKQVPQLSTLLSALGIAVVIVIVGWMIFEHLQKGFAEEM